MNEKGLTIDDYNFILESLRYTEKKFREYAFPSYECRLERLADVNAVIVKVRAMIRDMRNAN